MATDPAAKYVIPTCKDFVPEPMRFWLYLAFVLVFQFSGGIYLALMGQMIGARAMMREDVMMAGYASFVGLTVVFPILFPLKFRFTGKRCLMVCAAGLIVCNLVTMNASSLLVLVPVCFVAGALRMVATFECNSTMQLKVTPTRDFAVFFPFLYIIILGMIQFSGIVAGWIAYRYDWQFMNLLIIGLLLVLLLCCVVFLKHIRLPAHGPAVKIDWLGMALWSLFLLQCVFVLEYGGHYDWFRSPLVGGVSATALATLAATVVRSGRVKHPFIDLRALGYANVPTMLGLFAAMCILLATPNVLQGAFTGGVLHYGFLETLSLNWSVLGGVALGVGISWLGLSRLGRSYRTMTILGFALILGYVVWMYLLVSPDATRAMMVWPLLLRGAGNAVVLTVISVYAARTVPFIHFFHLLALFGFVHTVLGSALGSSIVGHLLSMCMESNFASLGGAIDGQNRLAAMIPSGELVSRLHGQVLLASIKEAYGWMALFGCAILVATTAMRYRAIVRFRLPRW